MKFGGFTRAAAVVAASLLSVVAAVAQDPPASSALDIPADARIMGNAEPGVRTATAIVNGAVITETDIDQRLALIVASNRITLPPEHEQRFAIAELVDQLMGRNPEHRFNFIQNRAGELDRDLIDA